MIRVGSFSGLMKASNGPREEEIRSNARPIYMLPPGKRSSAGMSDNM